MNISLLLAANSIAFGGLLFLLSAGFALIFGLMRIPNLTHGSLFMLRLFRCVADRAGPELLARRDPRGIRCRRVRRLGRTPAAAPPARQRAGAGTRHTGPLVYDRRCVPHVVGRRPDL